MEWSYSKKKKKPTTFLLRLDSFAVKMMVLYSSIGQMQCRKQDMCFSRLLSHENNLDLVKSLTHVKSI